MYFNAVKLCFVEKNPELLLSVVLFLFEFAVQIHFEAMKTVNKLPNIKEVKKRYNKHIIEILGTCIQSEL